MSGTKLTDHFWLAEFTRSDTAARLGIDNTPSAEILARLAITAAGLEKVRVILGGASMQITSGYRSVALNAKVPGSSNTSAHTLGYAADFIAPAFGSPLDVCRAIEKSGLIFDQMIHEYGTWTHISFDPRLRRQLLTKRSGHPYETGINPI